MKDLIYEMELHDSIIQGNFAWVKRVPGGWIYYYAGDGVFVPFSNEFLMSDRVGIPEMPKPTMTS